MTPDPHQLAAEIKHRARALGFDLVGIAPARPSAYADYLRQWLSTGQAGTMSWLHNRFEERTNATTYLPGAKSIICVALNYHVPLVEPSPAPGGPGSVRASSVSSPSPGTPGEGRGEGYPPQPGTGNWELGSPPPFQLGTRNSELGTSAIPGRISRYALGTDYHELIKSNLHQLADHLRTLAPDAHFRTAVDTAPVMEKELSQLAGVGWLGKNSCLINERIGSWLLLGEILTTLDLPPDDPAVDRCGTCTRCIDACPTAAITAPYQLDARRCISYLTIEHRADDIPDDLRAGIGDWLYGCDICQDVCPWNKRAPTATNPALQPRFPTGTLDATEVLSWTPETYRRELKGSAMKRVKLPQLQRNAKIVLDNLRPKQETPS